jgi:hypothetical protein
MASRLRIGPALLASMLVASVARADPTAVDRETARTLMDQGRELERKGDVKDALKRFMAADEIMHVPTTALAVAKSQAALGLLVEARDTLASSMRRTPEKPTDPQPFKEARAEGDKLDTALAGRVPGLTIHVKGAGEGLLPALAIDGLDVPAGSVELPRAVDPGHHLIVAKTATAEGRQEVDVREGEQKQIELMLVSTGRAAVVPPVTPGASRTSHAPDASTWAFVGLAGAGVVVGAVTGIVAVSKGAGLAGECTNKVCGPADRADLSSAYSMAAVSDAAFAVAGVGALVAVGTLVIGHESRTEAPVESPDASGVTTHLWVGFGFGGVRGTF